VRSALAAACLVCLLAVSAPALASATVTIVNVDGPGEGFNDPTPAAPVGGNPGTTIGAQRRIAFQFAADIWGAALDSNATIFVRSNFDPLFCDDASGAVLGGAGTFAVYANFMGSGSFPGAEFADTWYHSALANKRAGSDIDPTEEDIGATFNSSLGQPGCTSFAWYYGLDNNHGPSQSDLVVVLLHELAHGLGFSTFTNSSSGAEFQGLPDVYSRKLLDTRLNQYWDLMTDAQRVASAIDWRRLVWDGPEVTAAVAGILQPGTPVLRVNSPPSVAGAYPIGPALFGPALSSTAVTGALVRALDPADATGPTTTDACSPLTNAAAVSGKVALVDRGTCTFVSKVKNCQNAGAIAVVVADNVVEGPLPTMAGTDATITIKSVLIGKTDADAIKLELGSGVDVSLLVDPAVRLGADDADRALLFAPGVVAPGSSVSHWDTIATPNQLMEPAVNGDLTHQVDGVDLTTALMHDIGWFPDADLDGVENDLDPDDDNDGVEDVSDCAPLDAGAFAIPGEVMGLAFKENPEKDTLSWVSAALGAGSGTVHDVLRGDLGELPVGTGPSETCVASGLSGAELVDASTPAPGLGYWYVVRAQNACGATNYGMASDGTPRESAICP